MANQLLNPPHKTEPFGFAIKIQAVNFSVLQTKVTYMKKP
jgi:hypothetical protein